MSLFVGVDGGGTRTHAVVVRADGAVLGRADGAAGRVSVLDPEAGADALTELTRSVLQQAGGVTVADGLCCALSGAGREPQRTRLESRLRESGIARTVLVVGDFEAALQDAFGAGPGILLIAGTGSAAWARAEDGRQERCGGWGSLIGDEGSAYRIGLTALRAALHAYDGRSGETELLARVLEHTKAGEPAALVAWAAAAAPADIAGLAPDVLDASATDTAAAGIVEEAVRELAHHVAALHARLAPWSQAVPLALAGGLLAPMRPLRPMLLSTLSEWELPLLLLDREVDAALGAATLALFAAAE